MSEKITKYNLEYEGVLCTGVQWGYGRFYFTKDCKEYEFDQTEDIQCVADTDHIRCVIKEQFLPWIKDEHIKELQAENAALRERLDKAIELPFELKYTDMHIEPCFGEIKPLLDGDGAKVVIPIYVYFKFNSIDEAKLWLIKQQTGENGGVTW